MARDHARFYVSIWHNKDFRALSLEAQHAYMTLVSQPGLSYAGVLDYIPSRLAALTADHTGRRVSAAVRRLTSTRFVLVDYETAELLVRTYVKHDGVLDRANMGKAVARAYGRVMSLTLRAALVDELAKEFGSDPDRAGWSGMKELDPDLLELVVTTASRMTSTEA